MICHPNVKINLGLHVLRRRPDGFHDLETLFVPYPAISDCLEVISGDDYSRTLASLKERYGTLTQAITPDGKLMITLARKEGVDWDPLKDLTAKAYALLAADYDLPPMKIYLEKRSPVGAGLGGGSADAAFALRAMAELAGLTLDNAALAEALNAGAIAGAAIDVYDMEPPIPADYPLLSAKNTLLTPHVAFLTKEAMVRRADIEFANVVAFLEGKPENVCAL